MHNSYFRLSEKEMNTILDEVLTVVKDWKAVANTIGIIRKEQQLMESAFNL